MLHAGRQLLAGGDLQEHWPDVPVEHGHHLRVCSVDKEDAPYRILRGTTMVQFFNMGAFSKDAITGLLMNFEDPMRLFFFATNFAILFYQTNTWTATPFKLEARKD